MSRSKRLKRIKLFQKSPPAPTPKPHTIDHFGGQLPANLAPSTYIRRWDSALGLGAATAVLTFIGTGLLAWHDWPFLTPPPGGLWLNLQATLKTMGWLATGGQAFSDYIHWYWDGRATDVGLLSRFTLIVSTTIFAGQWAFRCGLVPTNGIRHISGTQRLTHKEAVKAFQKEALEMGLTVKNAFMSLHPSARWVARQWKTHILVDGGTGSGKTQVMLYWLRQIFQRNYKLFLYDIKGDFTKYFYGESKKGIRRAVLLSPFDARSHIWDISRDVDNSIKAAAFAQSMIPVEEGSGKFWSQSAQMLLEATVLSLLHDAPGIWGFFDLKRRTDMGREAFARLIIQHSAKAATIIAGDNQASESVLATLASYTANLDKLAEAWPRPKKGRSIALSEWVKDGYKGPRQIIVQAGTDQALAGSVIASMVNVCANEIVSAKLPDNMTGRHLFFFIDEFTSLNPIRVDDLLDKSRSKGVGVCLAYQAESKIAEKYGQFASDAMTGMVGTHVHCRQLSSETRNKIIQLAGRRRVAITNTTISGGFHDGVAGSSSVAEEERDVLTPHDLGTLGPVYDSNGKFLGTKALVYTGGNYHELLFPPMELDSRDERGVEVQGIVPATWTLPGYKSVLPRTRDVPTPEPTPIQGGLDPAVEEGVGLPPTGNGPVVTLGVPKAPEAMAVDQGNPDHDETQPGEDLEGEIVMGAMMDRFGSQVMSELLSALGQGNKPPQGGSKVALKKS